MKISDIFKLPKFVMDNQLAYINSSTNPDYDGQNTPTYSLKHAEVILSYTAKTVDTIDAKKVHKPVLDIDMPVAVLPSSTEGHHHLFIDKEMPWKDYLKLLEVLAEVGIIEKGYLGACRRRGHSAVRLPWVKKPSE